MISILPKLYIDQRAHWIFKPLPNFKKCDRFIWKSS